MLSKIIPIIDSVKANKMLKEKNNSQEFLIPENINEINIDCIIDDYRNTIETKNRFEDKAKTIIAALTIAITLILNLSKMLENISLKYAFKYMNIVVFILALLSIIYMLMAGIVCIQVLIKENLVYQVTLIERSKKDKVCYYKKTQQNINQNLIRNNMIFSSYESIRNSVICLVIIFVLAIWPLNIQESVQSEIVTKNQFEKIAYENSAVEWLNVNKTANFEIDDFIQKYEQTGGNGEKSIYDNDKGVLVTIEIKENMYIIKDIKSEIETLK